MRVSMAGERDAAAQQGRHSGHARKVSARRVRLPKKEAGEWGDAASMAEIDAWESSIIEGKLRELANHAVNFDSEVERAHLQSLRQVAEKRHSQHNPASFAYVSVLSVFILVSTIGCMLMQSVLVSPQHLAFPLPIFASCVFFGLQTVLGWGTLVYMGAFWASMAEIFGTREGWRLFAAAMLPCSLATACDAALTEIALKLVSVSFYTMVKSSSLIFTLLGAFLVGLEQPHVTLLAVILITALGVVLAAWDPGQAQGTNWLGLGLVLGAAVLNAAKWTLTEVLLNQSRALASCAQRVGRRAGLPGGSRQLLPLLTVFLLSPVTFGALLGASALLEEVSAVGSLQSEWAWAGLMAGVGVLMYVIRVVEFRYVQLVSVVAFAFLGIVRQVILIGASMALLGDVVHGVNVAGLLVTMLGVALYSWYRARATAGREAAAHAALELELELELESVQAQRRARGAQEGAGRNGAAGNGRERGWGAIK